MLTSPAIPSEVRGGRSAICSPAPAPAPANYLRGRCLRVVGTGNYVEIRHIPGPEASGEDVVVPEAVWAELDLDRGAIGARRGLL